MTDVQTTFHSQCKIRTVFYEDGSNIAYLLSTDEDSKTEQKHLTSTPIPKKDVSDILESISIAGVNLKDVSEAVQNDRDMSMVQNK